MLVPPPRSGLVYPGCGVGTVQAQGYQTFGPSFDPTTIEWTGWWKGTNYDSSTGTCTGLGFKGTTPGNASRNLIQNTSTKRPQKGSALNGYDGIICNFNSSTTYIQFLECNARMDAVTEATASNFKYTAFAVASMQGAASTGAAGDWKYPAIWTDDGNGRFAAGVMTGSNGVKLLCSDTVSDKSVSGTATYGTPHVFAFWQDGVDMNMSLDGAAASIASCGLLSAFGRASTLTFGNNYQQQAVGSSGAITIWEMFITNVVLSGQQISDMINGYLKPKYALA